MSWLNHSIQVINEILQDSSIPWEQKLCNIDKAYPFGERKYHPYKQWLKARKLAKLAIKQKFINVLFVQEKKNKKINLAKGQLSFEWI